MGELRLYPYLAAHRAELVRPLAEKIRELKEEGFIENFRKAALEGE